MDQQTAQKQSPVAPCSGFPFHHVQNVCETKDTQQTICHIATMQTIFTVNKHHLICLPIVLDEEQSMAYSLHQMGTQGILKDVLQSTLVTILSSIVAHSNIKQCKSLQNLHRVCTFMKHLKSTMLQLSSHANILQLVTMLSSLSQTYMMRT